MKNRKSVDCRIVFTIITMLLLVTALALPVYAEETESEAEQVEFVKWEDFVEGSASNDEPAPMIFAETTPSASGEGWTWANDNQEKVLTLDGFKMTLKDYTQPYDAGIRLPGGATIIVKSDSGVQVIGKPGENIYPVGILADGDLTIKGNAMFLLDGENGADCIQAAGHIKIGEGNDPAKGLQLQARGTGYAINAGKSLSIKGVGGTLGVLDLYGVSKVENKGIIVAGVADDAQDEYAVDIRDCNFHDVNQNKGGSYGSYGIYAGNGSVQINNTDYYHVASNVESVNTTGIRTCNGHVKMNHSDVTLKLSTFPGSDKDPSMISAESSGSQPIPSPMILISDSLVQGSGDAIGLRAEGGIKIDSGSDIDLTTVGQTILAADEGFSVKGSEVELISTDTNINTINSDGPVEIGGSEIYVSAKGTGSTGLLAYSTVDFSGDSSLDIDGDLAAVQVVAKSTDSPITLHDDLEVRDGGTLQYVSDGGTYCIFSYSEDTLDQDLKNASKRVAIANNSQMMFIKQPEDQVVSYPAGTSFEVRVSRDDKVASYQWYLRDIVGNVFELEGDSAKTPELIVPSTGQRDNRLVYYCVVTDTAGNKLISKEAYLDMDNKAEDKIVLYVGNYALEPGQTLNLYNMPDPQIGTGKIIFDKNGTDITFDNVRMDNSKSIYDVRLSQAICIRLNNSKDTNGETYTVKLLGKNVITNYFQDSSGNGIPLDFLLHGDNELRVPTVVIDGESLGGTLTVKGGAQAIRATASMVINADVTVQKTRDGDTSYMDAIYCDVLNGQGQHDLTIGPNHKLDITSFGSGLSTPGAMTIGENTQIDIDMTMPYIHQGDSAGTTEVTKSAIYVGSDELRLKPGTKLNIKGTVDPYIMTNISSCNGIMLQSGSTIIADDSTINIDMTAKPYEDPIYVYTVSGINSTSGVTLENSDVSISVDGDEWTASGIGIAADQDITMNNCKADISASGNMQAFGIVSDTNVTMDRCDVDIASDSLVTAYGLAPNKDLNVKDSKIDVKTQCTGSNGNSFGVLGSNMNLDMSKPEYYIKSDATNANGLAFVANTGDAGNEERKYDPSYQAKMIKGTFNFRKPASATVNIASIPGSVHKYLYVESFYDTKDTSKPAVSAEIGGYKKENKATVSKTTRKISYKKLKKKAKSFKINAKVKENAKTTYKKISVSKKAKKYIKVSSKGKVTVKKGLKKGKYKLKVKITAAETKNYAKTVTNKAFIIIVK